jgi:hypothetical protein
MRGPSHFALAAMAAMAPLAPLSPHAPLAALRTLAPALAAILLGASAMLLGLAAQARAEPSPLALADTASPAISFGHFPEGPWQSACSFRHRLCVHAPPKAPSSRLLSGLSSADRAWDVLSGALALPPPDVDLDGAWHVYFVDDGLVHSSAGDAPGPPAAAQEPAGLLAADTVAPPLDRDPRTRFDSATSFALIDGSTPDGCALDLALARALARACLWRAAPATDEGSARAQTETMARLAVPCAPSDGDAQEFQSHPERALVEPNSVSFDRGASRFFDWLDASFAREPGGLVRGMWALAATRTPPGAWRWSGAPTGFDVLRVSLKGALRPDSTLDEVFVRFAVERARATPPVRLAWHVPWPSRARRLASPDPVQPTGASYVLVDRAGAKAGARLRVEAQWEDYGRMRWVVVKLDARGTTMAELPVTSLDRGTRASLTVESLEGVDRLLIIGVNVGSTDHPFDPNVGEWEPHGWLLTLDEQ